MSEDAEDIPMADVTAENTPESESQELQAIVAAKSAAVEALQLQLANLDIEERKLNLETDAKLIAMAHEDANHFFKTVAASGEAALEACDSSIHRLMQHSMDILALHLDAAGVPLFFVPTNGGTNPTILCSVHRDGKVARLQRVRKTPEGWTMPVWEMFIGASDDLKDLAYRRAIPTGKWITNLVEWSKMGCDASEQAPPGPPMYFASHRLNDMKGGPSTETTQGANEEQPKPSGVERRERPPPERRGFHRNLKRGAHDDSGRSQVDPRDPKVARFLSQVGAFKINAIGSTLPKRGNAYFDFVNGLGTHRKQKITREDVHGRKVVLLLGTSVISHYRLSEEGFGFFVDLGGEQPRSLIYPRYDFTHLMSDESEILLLQCGMSGWHTHYGPHPRNAQAIQRLLKERAFNLESGVRIDVLALQPGTNDLKFSLDGDIPLDARPPTDRMFFEEILADCSEFHDVFRPKLGTVILGLGTPKWRVAPTDNRLRNLSPSMLLEEQHGVLHRTTKWLKELAADDVAKLKQNKVLEIMHSPLRMLPPQACVSKATNFGHVLQSWFGDMALNVTNSVRNGLRMLDPSYRCPLLHCYGIPRRFSADFHRIRGSVHPHLPHEHGSAMCKRGVTVVRSAVHSSESDRGTWYSMVDVGFFSDLPWTFW